MDHCAYIPTISAIWLKKLYLAIALNKSTEELNFGDRKFQEYGPVMATHASFFTGFSVKHPVKNDAWRYDLR